MPASSTKHGRRAFLATTLAVVTAPSARRAQAALVGNNSARIQPKSHDLMRVRIELEVKGNVRVSTNALTSNKTSEIFPVTSKAKLDYEERSRRPNQADESEPIVAAERYYHTATSSSVLNKTATEQELRPALRNVVVRRDSLPETLYSGSHFFTHGELSLLKSPASSVSVEQLLPGEDVIEGDRYEIDADAICSVLNLSTLESGKVECTVDAVLPDAVRFKLEGDVKGSVDGVGTRLRLAGKMTYDRKLDCCTWLALGIHETREISRAEPGFDVSAIVKMVRRPLDSVVALPAQPAAIDFDQAPPAGRLYVELQSRQLRVGSMMDRRWRMIRDTPGTAVMRMIDANQSIAQCNLRSLVRLPEGREFAMEDFEADVRQTLGEQLQRIVEADQRVSAQGLKVLRLVADGEIERVPIRWIIMHASDDFGRRVQATFTMSGDLVGTFAGNDAQFADSLRFLDEQDLHDAKPGDADSLAGVGPVAEHDPELSVSDLSPDDQTETR